MRKVRVGFVGCGAVAELHFQGLKACPEAELAGIYDWDEQKLKKREKLWGVKAFASLEDLLHDPEIDAVFVLTPVEFHYKHVMQALQAEKHVLVEKPVARSVQEIEEMDRLAKSKGLQCMPAHNYIYLPDVIRLKNNLEAGIFGTVAVSWIMFHIHHSEELAARYPGVIRQIGTHLLYTHRYLFGSPKGLSAHTTNLLYPHLQREDQAMMTLSMPDGSLSNLFASFAVSDLSSNPWTYIIKVLGTQGSTQFSWQDIVFERALGTLSRSYGKYEETYENEIDYFINQCILQQKLPLSTMEDAKEVLKLVNKAEESAKKSETVEKA